MSRPASSLAAVGLVLALASDSAAQLMESPRPMRPMRPQRQEVSILLGTGVNGNSGTVGFASGPEYRRIFTSRLAAGGTIGTVYYNEEASFVVLANGYLRMFRNVELMAGGGLSYFCNTNTDEGAPPPEGYSSLVGRVGLGYRIEMGRDYRVTPSVTADFGGRMFSLVVGSSFGIPF